jgi:type VI secretion system secreted protein Hcp
MLLRNFILQNKITVLLLTITIGLSFLLVSCAELPAPSPVEPTEPAQPKETPIIPQTPVPPTQPPTKPEALPSPAPPPVPPAPVPIPSPPPTEEKLPSNGLVEPQSTSTTSNGGANKIFLNVDGIAGESLDAKHDEWIDVISFSHGISQPTSTITTRTAGRSIHEDFTIVKELDKSSPKLALACCKGDYITEVIIEVCRADTSDKYMRYTLTDVIVASISQHGSSQDEDARPVEEISLRYGRIDWSYTEIDPMTSKAKGNVEAYWDLETDKGS